jgi:ribonuclease HIII
MTKFDTIISQYTQVTESKDSTSAEDSFQVQKKLKEIKQICKKYKNTIGPNPYNETLKHLENAFEVWFV